jgi:hypothetical protein
LIATLASAALQVDNPSMNVARLPPERHTDQHEIQSELKPAAPARPNTKVMTNAMPRRSRAARKIEPSGVARPQARNAQTHKETMNAPASILRYITTDMIDMPDYGENARYSLFEQNVVIATWLSSEAEQLAADASAA